MDTYIIDDPLPRRHWQKYKPALKRAEYDPKQPAMVADGHVIERGIVVVHRSSFVQYLDKLAKVAERQPGIVVIVISGGQNQGVDIARRLYFRQKPVYDDVDASFAACLEAFCRRAEGGEIDFSLLEPRWSPTLTAAEFLCEGYRLAHADPALIPAFAASARRVRALGEKRSLTEGVDWWRRGLSVSSLDMLLERIEREVPGRELRTALEAVFHGQTVQPEAVQMLHEEVVRLRTAIS